MTWVGTAPWAGTDAWGAHSTEPPWSAGTPQSSGGTAWWTPTPEPSSGPTVGFWGIQL